MNKGGKIMTIIFLKDGGFSLLQLLDSPPQLFLAYMTKHSSQGEVRLLVPFFFAELRIQKKLVP